MSNHLANAFPELDARLPHVALAELPTPTTTRTAAFGRFRNDITIKCDDVTGRDYGGNKVRKLEYILQKAKARDAASIATFGTVGSHHALATAIYALKAGFGCTCFLSHQSMQPRLGDALRIHQRIGTHIVRYGGSRAGRIGTLREHLRGQNTWVVPLGGSSWLGSLGYVNAGLELAAQIEAGEVEKPSRIYIALGTTGTAVGLGIGLALAGLDCDVQAVRVSHDDYSGEPVLRRLLAKTVSLMHRFDPSVPADVAKSTCIVRRDGFFADGYGRSSDEIDAAIAFARDELGLSLETTYTGKAMAALRRDLSAGYDRPVMFWNTYNSRPLDVDRDVDADFSRLPGEFARYFDDG